MEELQLIKGCKEGKREYQKLLYEKYAKLMYAICLRYAANTDEAQDILQDGFIKVFSAIGSFEAKGSFEGWIKRIFINLALQSIRREKAFSNNEDIENVPDLIDESDEERANDISEKALLEMIEELPNGYRAVFNLYAIENMSHKEIAGMLNIAEVTSRSQYTRARQILQTKVLEYLKKNS